MFKAKIIKTKAWGYVLQLGIFREDKFVKNKFFDVKMPLYQRVVKEYPDNVKVKAFEEKLKLFYHLINIIKGFENVQNALLYVRNENEFLSELARIILKHGIESVDMSEWDKD